MPNDFLSPELQTIEREHRRDVRIVEARPLLMRVGFATLVVVDIIMAIFFVVVIIGYIISGSFSDLRSMASLATNADEMQAIASQSRAKDMSVGSVKVLQGTDTSYDFYTLVKNTNSDWYATFTYVFSSGGTTSRIEDGFVMPGEEKYLMSFGNTAESRPSSVTVTIGELVWHHINRHEAPDVQAWLNEHRNFTVADATYSSDIGLANDKIGRTTFTLTNTTPYAYWTPQFTVILERAGAIVGVSKATVSEFSAGDVRSVEVRWYGELAASGTVTVVPDINYFDEDVYMPPQGMPANDPRDNSFDI